MRLDLFLTENGFADSRTKAKILISEGKVKVNGLLVIKPSFDVEPNINIDVSNTDCYVGRGALKLVAAIDKFDISIDGKSAIDIGASTGGFTQVLLQKGASAVYSVDVGRDQLHPSLRSNDKVVCIENFNARYMTADSFPISFDIAVCDVSFISQTLILPAVSKVLKDGGEFITLIKPQFECGRAGLGKSGVVKDEKVRQNAIDRVLKSAEENGFKYIDIIRSPIEGGDGNIEYVCYFTRT